MEVSFSINEVYEDCLIIFAKCFRSVMIIPEVLCGVCILFECFDFSVEFDGSEENYCCMYES